MASESTTFATDAPPSTAPASAHPTEIPSQDEAVRDAVRLLKRPRSPSPASPRSLAAQSQHLLSLRSPHKSARLILESAGYPHPLTGAAALEDERRRREEEERAQQQPVAISENPGQRALAALMSGATQAMSRPADAPQPAPTAAMEPVAKIPNTTTIPINSVGHVDHGETSPQSVAGVQVTESPTPMDVDGKVDHPISSQQVVGQEEKLGPQPGSLSYPGSLQSTGSISETPKRGMSFPMPSPGQTSPTSSGAKKHKCPYCNTEFTRHHNLKSHLLTHSQEKPYVCTECPMRFRRLHDLKRHGKLHTGERPHVCPKCDRGFARGDALARHSKGAGGCAGRRSSMTSFADGDELDGSMVDPDDSTMSGLAYENPEEDELRRQSLPSINAQHVTGSQSDAYGAHSRTYPPVGNRGSSGGLYPPNVNQNQAGSNVPPNVAPAGHTPNTSISSVPVSGSTASMYSQSGITESPKPLSPGVPAHEATNIARQRSPSLSQQLQQQQFGRRQSELQSPHSGQPRPKLPGLSHPGFAPPNSTGFSHTRTGSGAQATTDSGNMFAQSDPSVWAYIQTLEERVKSLSEKVATLDQEMAVLKQQNESRDTLVKT